MRTISKPGLIVGYAGAVALLAACVTTDPSSSTGADRPQHRNYWNYYQYGLAQLDQGQYAAARESFEIALGLRSGAKYGYEKEHWRVRTYGMHFLDHYFPHRELGIASYHLGDWNQAQSSLQQSLDQLPSGRAKHYMNLVQKQRAAQANPAPPVLAMNLGRAGLTKERSLQVQGTAKAEGHVSAVTFDDGREFIELAKTEYRFSRDVPLQAGTNVIEVTVRDLVGQTATESLTWVTDWRPPTVVVTDVQQTAGGWTLRAIARDEYGIKAIDLDGKPVFRVETAEGKREHRFEVTVQGESLLMARDRAGNQITVPFSAQDYGPPGTLAHYVQYASAGDSLPHGSAPQSDGLPPTLDFFGMDQVTVTHEDEFFVDGRANDPGGLAIVSIEGENQLSDQDRGARQTYFARRIPLATGSNTFSVAAVDSAGNQTSRDLTVIRITPEPLELKYRLRIAVPPLVASDESAEASLAHSLLQAGFLEKPVRFNLLERDEGWDYVLQEQELSLSDLADESAALKIRKLLPAEILFMGTVVESDKGITVALKAVNSETADVLFIEDVYTENVDKELDFQLAGLTLKTKQHYPLLEGTITTLKGDRAILDLGADQGATVGLQFMAVRAEEGEDPLFGEVIKHQEQLVRLQIDRSRPDRSVASIIPSAAQDLLEEGDRIYAR